VLFGEHVDHVGEDNCIVAGWYRVAQEIALDDLYALPLRLALHVLPRELGGPLQLENGAVQSGMSAQHREQQSSDTAAEIENPVVPAEVVTIGQCLGWPLHERTHAF